jgi:hypothetical protein
VTERLLVEVGELVPLSLPELLGLAPIVTEAVSVTDTERDSEVVLVGEFDDVGVPDDVGDPVDVTLSDCVVVPLLLGEIEALASSVTLEVAVFESEDESVVVELGVDIGVSLVDDVGVPVAVPVGVIAALTVEVAVTVGVTVAVRDKDDVPLALPPTLCVVVGVAETVLD